MMTCGIDCILKNEFSEVNNPRYFGFIKNGVDLRDVEGALEYAESDSGYVPRNGGKFGNWFIKRLGEDEVAHTIGVMPNRFKNHLCVHDYFPKISPEPLGLFYCGKPTELLGEKPNMYVISENIDGKGFLRDFKTLESKEDVLRNVYLNLIEMRERGFYLMDFAPRDIILPEEGYRPVFVDFEHLEFGDRNKDDKDLVEKQVEQARKDYGLFLGEGISEEELNMFLGRLGE